MKKGIDVKRVDQSPTNPRQWCVELVCGHERWVTRGSRPKATKMECVHGCRPLGTHPDDHK